VLHLWEGKDNETMRVEEVGRGKEEEEERWKRISEAGR